MEFFILLLDILPVIGQGAMHLLFLGRLTEKPIKARHFLVYCALLGAIQRFCVGDILPIGAGMLALYGVGRLLLGAPRPVCWLAAVLAFYLSQLSFGIVNSLEAAIFPALIGNSLLYLLLLAAQVLFFVLCGCCYRAALKLLSWQEGGGAPYLGLLLLPSLFFFAAELYILHTAYRFSAVSLSQQAVGKHGALLLLQIMGLAALFCALYAYRQLRRGFQAQAALQSLTQAAHGQKVYIEEARRRYEQTKSFRHDVRNHLSVLDGLLRGGKLEESRRYLKKLETVSESLSFPYQTSNPVVDILLGEKLGLAGASGIEAEVTLLLPNPCGIDDFDLCALFANALDNAVAACRSSGGDKIIRIGGKRQGDFYLLTFENTCSAEPAPPAGTGLSNIQAVAEKYRGAALAEKRGNWFFLSVLLNIS